MTAGGMLRLLLGPFGVRGRYVLSSSHQLSAAGIGVSVRRLILSAAIHARSAWLAELTSMDPSLSLLCGRNKINCLPEDCPCCCATTRLIVYPDA